MQLMLHLTAPQVSANALATEHRSFQSTSQFALLLIGGLIFNYEGPPVQAVLDGLWKSLAD